MGNIVLCAGLEPTSLAIRARVLPLHHVGSLTSPLYPRPLIYAVPCLKVQYRLLHSSPWNCMYITAYNYIHTDNGFTYTYTGQVQQPHSSQLVQGHGHATSVMGVTNMGNIVPRARVKPTSLTFPVSVLRLHHIDSQTLPLYPRLDKVFTHVRVRVKGMPM